MESLERRIFGCSFARNNGEVCPVAKKFKEINGERPIPEAYLGNPRAKSMIIGINPGSSENYLDCNFEDYQQAIRDFWKLGEGSLMPYRWVWNQVVEIFNYPSFKEDGALVTNLVHCPTKFWNRKVEKTDKWFLTEEEKKKALTLCNRFCLDLIEKVDPELIFLHGSDVLKFFSDNYRWNVKDPKSLNIVDNLKQGDDGRTYVLSPHIQRLAYCSKNPMKESYRTWQLLRDASEKLRLKTAS